MAQQELHRPDVAGLSIDQRRFGPTKGVGSIGRLLQTDHAHPLVDNPAILAGAQMPLAIPSAWKQPLMGRQLF